jgi:hypothetical protein
MITWIKDNAGLASLLGAVILIISSGAVGWHQLSELVAQQPEIQKHLYDTSHHVDPEEKKKMEERIDKLETRVLELEAARWRQFIDRQRVNARRDKYGKN